MVAPSWARHLGVHDPNHGRRVYIKRGKFAGRDGVYLEKCAVFHKLRVEGAASLVCLSRDVFIFVSEHEQTPVTTATRANLDTLVTLLAQEMERLSVDHSTVAERLKQRARDLRGHRINTTPSANVIPSDH